MVNVPSINGIVYLEAWSFSAHRILDFLHRIWCVPTRHQLKPPRRRGARSWWVVLQAPHITPCVAKGAWWCTVGSAPTRDTKKAQAATKPSWVRPHRSEWQDHSRLTDSSHESWMCGSRHVHVMRGSWGSWQAAPAIVRCPVQSLNRNDDCDS